MLYSNKTGLQTSLETSEGDSDFEVKKPRYLICDVFGGARVIQELRHYRSLGYVWEDIFILGPSVGPESYAINILKKAEK